MADRAHVILRHLQGSQPNGAQLQATAAGERYQSVQQDQLRFTVPSHTLTATQRHFYEQNGFIVIKNLVPKDKIAKYRQQFLDICEGRTTATPPMLVMKDVAFAKDKTITGQRAITKIQGFYNDEILFDYCRIPEVLRYVSAIIGDNVMAMHTMLINKPPDTGTMTSRHPIHQDLYYFPFRPAERVVCAWTAMERVHRGNGCLVVVPGSHTLELMEHGYPDWEGGVNGAYFGVKNYDSNQPRVWVEMDEGDTVLFHPILLHGSGANRTNGFRKAISCHYAASECEYIDLRGTVQEAMEENMLQARRKTGRPVPASMADLWREKARLVSGKVLNM